MTSLLLRADDVLRRRLIVLVPLVVFLGLVGLFLIRLFSGDPSRIPSALIGQPAPQINFPPVAGLERNEIEEAAAGDIVAVSGIEGLNIGDTITDAREPEGIYVVSVDEPTVSMSFMVNASPFAGREGKFLTSRQIRERLMRELESNVALRVADT